MLLKVKFVELKVQYILYDIWIHLYDCMTTYDQGGNYDQASWFGKKNKCKDLRSVNTLKCA